MRFVSASNSSNTARARSLSCTRGGCLTKLFVVFTLTAVACVLAWIFLLPSMVTRVIESRTGFSVQVSSLSINPFTSRVAIEGLVIKNPTDSFKEEGFVNVRSFKADAELATLLTDRIVLEEAIVDVEKVTLVRNANNEFNGTVFAQRLIGESSAKSQEQTAPAETPAKTAPAPARKVEFLIRKMTLRLDTIAVVDTSGSSPKTRELKLSINQDYENVTEVTQMTTPLATQILAKSVQIGGFAKELGLDAWGEAKKAGKGASETIKGIFQSIKDKTKN